MQRQRRGEKYICQHTRHVPPHHIPYWCPPQRMHHITHSSQGIWLNIFPHFTPPTHPPLSVLLLSGVISNRATFHYENGMASVRGMDVSCKFPCPSLRNNLHPRHHSLDYLSSLTAFLLGLLWLHTAKEPVCLFRCC